MEPMQLQTSWKISGMTKHQVSIKNVKSFQSLQLEFNFSEQQMIVITGKNGIGKTTIVKALKQIYDPKVFTHTSSEGSISDSSEISVHLSHHPEVIFQYNKHLKALDTKSVLPAKNTVVAELPVPFGDRFRRYSDVSAIDVDLRTNIATSNYKVADELKAFLVSVYGHVSSHRYENLCETRVKGTKYYFIPQDDDYYLREDHFSSGEFFLIQLFRFIKTGAKFIIIDEVDIALDAVAQVNLYNSLTEILQGTESKIILISHSLALMKKTPDGALFYLESIQGKLTLESKSFGYINSDLYGFKGSDKYILTEDPVLEGFILFIIQYFNIQPDYEYKVIGVGGCNQLKTLLMKNEVDEPFSNAENVLAVLDNDAYPDFKSSYEGRGGVVSSGIDDLELFIYLNRKTLFTDNILPPYAESSRPKTASKSYWKWLTVDRTPLFRPIELYKKVVEQAVEESQLLAGHLKSFLYRD